MRKRRHHQTTGTDQEELLNRRGGTTGSEDGHLQQPISPPQQTSNPPTSTAGGPIDPPSSSSSKMNNEESSSTGEKTASCSKLRRAAASGSSQTTASSSLNAKPTVSANEQLLENEELANYWSGLKRVRHELEEERKVLDEKEHLITQISKRLELVNASEGQKEKEQLKLLRQDWLKLTLKTKVCAKVMISHGATSEAKLEQARALIEANLEEKYDFEKPCELVWTAVEAKLREFSKSQGIAVKGPYGVTYFFDFLESGHGPEAYELFNTGYLFAHMARKNEVYDREVMGWVLKHVRELFERLDVMKEGGGTIFVEEKGRDKRAEKRMPAFRRDEFIQKCVAAYLLDLFDFDA